MTAAKWGSPAEVQTKLRIRLAVYARAYERFSTSLVDDHTFDALSLKVDLSVDTGNDRMDQFFRESFEPSTGMWIADHPDIAGIDHLYLTQYQPKEPTRRKTKR